MKQKNLGSAINPNAALYVRRIARFTRIGFALPLNLTMRLYGGSDKWSHQYGPYYAEHFRSRRWKTRLLLEIGVGGYEKEGVGGGSLRVWRDYFPRARIVGLDLNKKQLNLGKRVAVVQGDQTRNDSLDDALRLLGGPPNIVIDDGSHFAGHAETSFQYLFPLMPTGSVYVIEDIHTSYWEDFGGSIPSPLDSASRFAERLVDSVQRNDPTFTRWAKKGNFPAPPGRDDICRLDVRPGIIFIVKC